MLAHNLCSSDHTSRVLQVPPPSSVSPVSRRRSKEGAAHAGHPGPAGGLPVNVLDITQGEKQSVVDQGSQHGDGLFSSAQLGRHGARGSPVSGSVCAALLRKCQS